MNKEQITEKYRSLIDVKIKDMSQRDAVFSTLYIRNQQKYLFSKKPKPLTSFEAWETLGVSRLADVVFKLKKDGLNIETVTVRGKNKFGHNVTFGGYILNIGD